MTDTTADTLAAHVWRHDGRCDCDSEGTYYASSIAFSDHLAAALAPVVAAQVEAARAEAVAPVLALADEWERHTATPGISLYAAVRDIRAAVTPEGVAAHNRAERAAAWDEGYEAACDASTDPYITADIEAQRSNPYRADALDQGDDA